MPRRLAVVAALLLPLAGPAGAAEFVAITPTHGAAPVQLRASGVVRIGRLEGHTMIDTAGWSQQPTQEPVDQVARRVIEAGQPLIPLTDASQGRIWVAPERIVLVRPAENHHPAGSRAAIMLDATRLRGELAVREAPAEILAGLRRAAAADGTAQASAEPR